MKYINVGVDEELHKRIKIESAQRGISITKYVTDCLGSIGSTKGVPEKKPQELTNKDKKETPKEVDTTEVIPPTNLSSNLYRNQIVNPAPKPKK